LIWSSKNGEKQLDELAKKKLGQRLEKWEKPAIDTGMEYRLAKYVKENM